MLREKFFVGGVVIREDAVKTGAGLVVFFLFVVDKGNVVFGGYHKVDIGLIAIEKRLIILNRGAVAVPVHGFVGALNKFRGR